MDKFPTLYSKRLILRKADAQDIPALLKHGNNKKIAKRILNMPYPFTEPQAVFWLSQVSKGFKQKNRYVFAIILKTEKELIGVISLNLNDDSKAELGYWLGEEHWNKGIITEAIEKVVDFAFTELSLNTVFATTHLDNDASQKVLEKNSFKFQNRNGNVKLYTLDQKEYNSL